MRAVLRRWDLLLLVALQLLFVAWPQLDLIITGWFWEPGRGFYLNEHPLVQFSYHFFADVHFVVFYGLLAWIAWTLYRADEPKRRQRRSAIFLLVTLLLGPGLIVNEVLKAYSGRARPSTVQEFGGDRQFTGAFQPANQCDYNCSFVSGHAGIGFSLITLAWLRRQYRWMVAGVLLGGLIGLGRVMQGAHFASDVIFSFWVVYGTAFLMARLMLHRYSIREPAPE